MSAGEFFDLVRPVFLVVSALLSTLVFVNARRNGFRLLASFLWAIATLFLPFVVLPLYLLVRLNRRTDPAKRRDARKVLLVPSLYLLAVLALIALAQYRDYNGVDAHLARATQARLYGDRERAIREYNEALAIEDNSHTHKLLAMELNAGGDWTGALSEFRLAERGGEPDPLLPFRIGVLLDQLHQPNQAAMEFKRFLYSDACLQSLPDSHCEQARVRVDSAKL
jgi:tetratricopeptide (TPR) repeat protein